MGVTWQGRPELRLKEDPTAPIGLSWDGVLLIDSGWAAPTGAKHLEAVNSLLAYDYTPQNQCRFLNTLGYGIPIDPSCINDFGKKWAVTEDHRAMTATRQNTDYYAQHIKEVQCLDHVLTA